jgi:hypothetical protein
MAVAVDIEDLKKITNIILDRMITKLKLRQIPMEENQDFYWNVPSDVLFKVREAQPELDIGRLSDDWEFLKNILEDPDNGVSLMLIHVAPLLRWIGEKVGQ